MTAGRSVPTAVVTNYQRREDGGCDNTSSWVDDGRLVQRTCTERRTPQGTRLALPPPSGTTDPRL